MNASGQLRTDRPDRRIALVQPFSAGEEKITRAMQMVDSVLWAFKGTTRANWTTSSPESADVIFVPPTVHHEHVAEWKSDGKLVVMVTTDINVEPGTSHMLVFPFRAVQVLDLLDRLDVELTAANAPTAPSETPQAIGASHKSDESSSTDAWSFVESLRTLREVQNTEVWLVARNAGKPLLWLKADCTSYSAAPTTVQAIRTGTFDLSQLTLTRGAPPPAGLAPRFGMELNWFAGYYASDRLAPWLDGVARYRILRWPNIGLIRPRPSQIRIAATLAAAPVTVAEIASKAQVPMDEAIRTLNALVSCEMAVLADPQIVPQRPRQPLLPEPDGGFRAFFRNMRRHLKLDPSG